MKMEFYKPQEIAKQLRVSTETVRNMCRIGQLKCVRIGGKLGAMRIPASSFEKYLAEATETPELPSLQYDNLPGLNR